MIFQNSLYKIHSTVQSDASYSMTLELEHTHPLFKGHFPGSPVLPGVVLLQIIRECAETVTAATVAFDYQAILQCKFPMPIAMSENRTIQLDFTLQPLEAPLFRLNATVKDEQTVFAVLKAGLAVSF